MEKNAQTFSDPNAIRELLAINAIHHVISNIDPTLPIESQVELVKKMPEERLFDVGAIDSLSEFQRDFIFDLYKSAIQGKLFAAFPSFEDKMAHATSAQAIASIPDATTLDFDKNYNRMANSYSSKIIDYFFAKSKLDLTITPQDVAVKAILLRNSFKQYCSDISNPSRSVAIITGAVDKFLPDIVELKKNGLSQLLYSYFFSEYNTLFVTYSITTAVYKPNTPGLSDPQTMARLKDAYEKLKTAPDLSENDISFIQVVLESTQEHVNKNSNPGCLGILILLLTLVPTLAYAASRLFM